MPTTRSKKTVANFLTLSSVKGKRKIASVDDSINVAKRKKTCPPLRSKRNANRTPDLSLVPVDIVGHGVIEFETENVSLASEDVNSNEMVESPTDIVTLAHNDDLEVLLLSLVMIWVSLVELFLHLRT